MYAVRTCTCIPRASRRLFRTVAHQAESSSSTSTSSRLEWDTINGQWVKKSSDVDKNKRPAQSERQRILAELKEQRINEVTEPDPRVGVEGSTTSPSSSTSTSDGKPTIGSAASGAVSSSGKGKYTRGQDSSTLGVKVSKTLHGVPIPIRPLPPDTTDCCMSGCPRCVYDIYTEDLQLHFEAMDKAVKQLKARQVPRQEWPEELQVFVKAAEKKMKETKMDSTETSTTVTSNAGEIDDDADGISAFDIASQVVTDEIQDLDISLRTFLKFERELRQRRKRERAMGLAMNHVSSMSGSPSPPPPTSASSSGSSASVSA